MTAADVPFAMSLKNIARWNQVKADWLGYLAFEPDGCFIAEVNGRPAGTATTVTYDAKVGWIGMVLVHPDQRRRGIGSALLRHCIEHLRGRGIGSIKLDATPMGRPVYLPLGFHDEYEVRRYEGVMPESIEGATRGSVRQIKEGDLHALTAFEGARFGVERGRVLQSLARRHPQWSLLAHNQRGAITGYLLAHEGHEAVQIAPWVAADVDAARHLAAEACRRLAGRRIFLDVPGPNRAGVALIEQFGFTIQRSFTRMYLGDNAHAGSPQHIYATSGAEKG